MLIARDLTFSYNGGPVISFPDFTCQTGEHWLLLGQSGSGKTTLLHLLAGLRTPRTGNVRIGDTEINGLPRARLDRFRGKNIGIIYQQPHFIRSLDVENNLALTQQLSGLHINRDKIRELLNRLNVGHKLDASCSRLSQGEQQRVAIARALVNDPVVVLADEPTSALDDVNTDQVIDLLEEQATAVNATLLIVTHDKRLKDKFANQIVL